MIILLTNIWKIVKLDEIVLRLVDISGRLA